MNDIPEGYTYTRCDQYTAEEFVGMFKSKDVHKIAEEYVQEHPKEIYNTDDEIAIHDILKGRYVTSLMKTRQRNTTKRYKFKE